MQNKQGLGPGARLTIAVSLCILVSFPFFLFYSKALPRLQALVQGKEMREKENIVTMTRYVNTKCKKKLNIVYLKTHKVRDHPYITSYILEGCLTPTHLLSSTVIFWYILPPPTL